MTKPFDAYNLDFDTCTMNDVIEASLVRHRAAFVAKIREQLQTHRDYLPNAGPSGARGVKASIAACEIVQGALLESPVPQVESVRKSALSMLTLGARIIAFNVACKLQEIPSHVRTAIAVREAV